MSRRCRVTIGCLFVFLCASCIAASPRTEFEQSFIGLEWEFSYPEWNRHPISEECKHTQKFELYRGQKPLADLSVDSFVCNGRYLELFGQFTLEGKIKVVDALVLPKFGPGELLMRSGDCELNGSIDTDFFAIVRLGRREKVDWRTGIRAAWYPNPDTLTIESLSTRHIVCWRPTPP